MILHILRPEALQIPLPGSFLGIGSESTSHSPIAKVFSVLLFSCPLLLELGFTLQWLFHIYSYCLFSKLSLFFILCYFSAPFYFLLFFFFFSLVEISFSLQGMLNMH